MITQTAHAHAFWKDGPAASAGFSREPTVKQLILCPPILPITLGLDGFRMKLQWSSALRVDHLLGKAMYIYIIHRQCVPQKPMGWQCYPQIFVLGLDDILSVDPKIS